MLTEKKTQRKSTITENDEEVGICGSKCLTLILLSQTLAPCLLEAARHTVLTFCETACSLEQDFLHNTKKHFAVPMINLSQRQEVSPRPSCGQGPPCGQLVSDVQHLGNIGGISDMSIIYRPASKCCWLHFRSCV